MKAGNSFHILALALSSASSLLAQPSPGQVSAAKAKVSQLNPPPTVARLKSDSIITPTKKILPGNQKAADRFPWKREIVTTIFWIGENASGNNPAPNHASCWDKNWGRNYGGFDDPNPKHRRGLVPSKFVPRQNPFYCALPYNDKASTGHRPEAPHVVPWFRDAYQGPAVSTCKDRWVCIRKGNKIGYAQWEDAGPFRTDHWQYVFGAERPKPNLNKGAGLDVSPAVRDYLGLSEPDLTDWKFVDFSEVPPGPWSTIGDNNTFVINERKNRLAQAPSDRDAAVPQ